MKNSARFIGLLFAVLFSPLLAKADAVQIIKIGFVIPLSGGLAQTGEDIRDGALLAAAEQHDPHYQLKLLFEDSKYDPKEAVTAAQRLIDIEHVDVLVSLWDTADPIAPIAERKGVLHTAIRWNPHLTEKYKLTFTFESTYLSWIHENLKLLQAVGIKSVAAIGLESQGWNLSLNEFKRLAPTYGIKFLDWVTYNSGEADFRPLVTRALKGNPDLIFITNYPPELELMMRRIQEVRPGQKVSGYLEMLPDFSQFEGSVFVTQFDTEQWFLDRFNKHYGKPMYLRAQLAYDMMNILLQTYAKSAGAPGGKFTALQAANELKKLVNYPGASGNLTAHGQVVETVCVWKLIKGGKPLTLNPAEVNEHLLEKPRLGKLN